MVRLKVLLSFPPVRESGVALYAHEVAVTVTPGTGGTYLDTFSIWQPGSTQSGEIQYEAAAIPFGMGATG